VNYDLQKVNLQKEIRNRAAADHHEEFKRTDGDPAA
jgi:hypothetical protein